MTPPLLLRRISIVRLLPVLVILLGTRLAVLAECIGPAHPSEAWAGAQAVWIGTIESSVPTEIDPDYGPLLYRVRMAVDEVFFGNLEAGSEIELDQHAFSENGATPEVGVRYFVYAKNPNGTGFGLGVCSGSRRLEWAEEDIAFARTLAGKRPGPSFRGFIRSATQPYGSKQGLSGAQITIDGPGGRFETKADSEGRFVFEDAPPGRYRIDAIYPDLRHWLHDVEVEIPPSGARYMNIVMYPQNQLSGRLVDQAGLPVEGVTVEAMPLPPLKRGEMVGGGARTGPDGRYRIDGIPAGQYRVGVNLIFGPRKDSPHPATFYPGTTDWRKASVLTVSETSVLADLDFRLEAPLTVRLVRGQVVQADGQPAAKVRVAAFDPRYHDRDYRHFSEVVSSDENGAFELRVYEGIAYVLEASRHVQGEGNQCAPSVPLAEQVEEEQDHVMILNLGDAACREQWAKYESGPNTSR